MAKTVAAVVKLIDQFSSPSKKVAASSRNLEKRFENVGKVFTNTGTIFSNAGSALTKAVTAPLVGAGTLATKMAFDFDEAMAKVSTIADSTQVPMRDMEKSILNLSDKTGIAATDIADNVYNAISAGQKTGDAVAFVENATMLAKAGFTDSAAALDVLTTTLNAYGLESSETAKISDMLIQTQNLGKTTVGELASTMGKIIPTAKSQGVAFEQLAAGYAIMTSKGIATAETTTYMNSMLNELGKSGTKASDMLKSKTGKTFQTLMEEGNSLSDVLSMLDESAKANGKALGDMFGSAEAGKAALTLLNGDASQFNDMLAKMQDSTGSTEEAFGKMQTSGEKVRITINRIKNVGIQFGKTIMDVIAPYIDKFSDKIENLTKWFKKLSPEQQKTALKFGTIAAAIGPLLLLTGKTIIGAGNMITSFGKLAGAAKRVSGTIKAAGGVIAMLTSPVGIAVTAVTILIVAGIALYKNWDKVKAWLSKTWENITESASKLWQTFKDFGNNIKTSFLEDWKTMKDGVVGFFANLYDTGAEKFEALKKILTNVGEFITGAFTTTWSKAWNGLKDIVGNAFGALEGLVKTPINAVIGLVNKAIGAINKISVDLPDIVGGGHIGFDIPYIPALATGTDNWRGGIVQVHERGGEIIDLPQGTRVYPHDKSVRMARAEGEKKFIVSIAKLADQIVVREEADIDKLASAFIRKLEQTSFNMA